jgi:hypothetical protein
MKKGCRIIDGSYTKLHFIRSFTGCADGKKKVETTLRNEMGDWLESGNATWKQGTGLYVKVP